MLKHKYFVGFFFSNIKIRYVLFYVHNVIYMDHNVIWSNTYI